MKISAMNRLEGRIVEIRKGRTAVRAPIAASGTRIAVSIANQAVDRPGLEAGVDG